LPLEQSFMAADKSQHALKEFQCGKPQMNEFLARHAIKHAKLGLSKTYVLAENTQSQKKRIAAYYTLSGATVSREEIPVTNSLPAYPLPVVLLARLAVDKHYQGSGLGAKTLVSALRQAATLSRAGLPAYGLILDVLDQEALGFYQNFELFLPFTEQPMRLFVPMGTINRI
ncbi:MAG: GNAT family N-acetyltransferase, partial [Natronospirillum sp.]